jgi:uncharacterized protein (TIGR02246 family)
MSRSIGGITLALLIVGTPLAGAGVWWSLGSVVAQSETRPKPVAADTATQPENETAIRAAMQSFVKAFGLRDAKALAAHWTTQGEYQNDSGKTVRGRDALEKAFAQFFAKTPEVQAEARSESLRFLSNDAAIDEGVVTIRRNPLDPPSTAHFSVFFVREQGRWLMARLSESSEEEVVSIADLGWMIGEWKALGGQDAEIRTTYAWDANKKFIHVQFTIAGKVLSLTGTQIIGVDPATGGIRTWTFEADGGVGVADWNRDGDHWELHAAGTLADGRQLTETNILRRVNNDTITWQSIDRSLDGADIADLPPVKVTRIKPEK